MRISKAEIEAAKRGQDLRAVIESYGVKLKKKGANYVGLCPFHEEKSPSFTVNPKTDLWHWARQEETHGALDMEHRVGNYILHRGFVSD